RYAPDGVGWSSNGWIAVWPLRGPSSAIVRISSTARALRLFEPIASTRAACRSRTSRLTLRYGSGWCDSIAAVSTAASPVVSPIAARYVDPSLCRGGRQPGRRLVAERCEERFERVVRVGERARREQHWLILRDVVFDSRHL